MTRHLFTGRFRHPICLDDPLTMRDWNISVMLCLEQLLQNIFTTVFQEKTKVFLPK